MIMVYESNHREPSKRYLGKISFCNKNNNYLLLDNIYVYMYI